MHGLLLDVFLGLRARGFPIAAPEHLDVLKAMSQGHGLGSRRRLIRLCAALWAKSPADGRTVETVMSMALPASCDYEEVRSVFEEGSGQPPPQDAHPGREPAQTASESGPRITFARGETCSTPGGALNAPLACPESIPRELDFSAHLPLSIRHMKQAWRRLRSMDRNGTSLEIDLEATIKKIHDTGVFLTPPVLRPCRRNRARLVILVDQSASMAPFRMLTRPLLDTARDSDLDRLAVYYFQNVPHRELLFTSPLLDNPVTLARAMEKFEQGSLLVLSDAGAARGGRNPDRTRATAIFCEAARQATPKLAWFNPLPRDRWESTTARDIAAQCRVPMFPLDSLEIFQAMDALKGKVA